MFLFYVILDQLKNSLKVLIIKIIKCYKFNLIRKIKLFSINFNIQSLILYINYKGEPNVSYICSRYYRAPELIFGATDYNNAIDVWSTGSHY